MTSVLLKDITLSFGPVEVLKKLNLDIAEGLAELAPERLPVLEWSGGEERQLARPARRRVAVHGNARAVGAAVRHLLEHRAQVPAERLLDLR